PASAISGSRASMAAATASATRTWAARGRKPGIAWASAPCSPRASALRAARSLIRPRLRRSHPHRRLDQTAGDALGGGLRAAQIAALLAGQTHRGPVAPAQRPQPWAALVGQRGQLLRLI